ncbi:MULTISPECIES: HlyD family efflux transporter periplasmic adaptor subunit [Novosphingobium]|uniref:HlyD family efflux transporter periplasmic adaptor subunit n=1 Tax=Novosphingobium decolorationis TaxID=2698673 RepID=A0ABX8E4Z7_9SPHN|nr:MULTISPECIES: HlyD family efflux transporter periplasmic adaptor subunit [Novosphingobium]QVM83315.1 HlyD family efflux transporter periplasmic adaptor subunit [Novosphingobium decolorationis]GAM05840.1 RND family multidrug resistance secretion protein [Novosphingobium sp. MBES04]
MTDTNTGGGAGSGAGAEGAPEKGSVIHKSKRKTLLMGLGGVVAVAAVLWGGYEFFIGSRSVSTDNAYVAGENADVTPLTSGRVTEVLVTDTQPVRKGQLLFRIEDKDQKIALAEAEANLERAKRMYGQSLANNEALAAAADANQAQIDTARANLQAARADLTKATSDFTRRNALAGSGAVSTEELTSAKQALDSAQAAFEQARAALKQAQASAVSARQQEQAAVALTKGTDVETAPEIKLAQARYDAAKLDLERTVVRAPIAGVVAQRSIQVGQKIQNGSPAMVIVPVDKLYVDANFKEDKLGQVRAGQSATLTSDFYGGDVEYHGKVVGFSGGTGAAFSLIPAQNATGNWIKVVQRLPVRIELDQDELKAHPLRVGLSMEAEIDLTSER